MVYSVETEADWFHALESIDALYGRMGEGGRDLVRTFRAIGTPEFYDPGYDEVGAFHGFSLSGFLNKSVFGPRALRGEREFLSIRTHEIIHAIQHFVLAATHADPVNGRSSIALCPRDMVKLEELKERSAYAGQYLFETLYDGLVAGREVTFTLSDWTPEEEQGMEEVKANMRASVASMMDEDDRKVKRIYNGDILDRYEKAIAARRDELERGEMRFVRLEDEDIAAAGDGFVLNIFTDAEGNVLREFLRDVELTPAQEARVRKLNEILGIDENALPTFGQALADAGTDREQFMIASITGAPSVSILGPPQPLPPPGPAPM